MQVANVVFLRPFFKGAHEPLAIQLNGARKPKIVKPVKNDFTNSDFLQNKCNEIKELIKSLLGNKLHKKQTINNSNFPGFLGSIKGVADEYKNLSHNFLDFDFS